MKFIEYFSNIAMPFMIIVIVLYGVIERKKVFDIFLEGAKEGISVVFNIFPTLVGLFVAIGALRSSGIIDLIVNFLTPVLNVVNFPTEILPLAIIRPISGSSSIAVYTSSVGIKKTRFVLWASLIADFVGIVTSVVVCRFLS